MHSMYRLLPAYEGGIVFTGESSKYDTSRGRRVVTHLSLNKRSKMRRESLLRSEVIFCSPVQSCVPAISRIGYEWEETPENVGS